MENGHYLYTSANNSTWKVGFTRRFKPINPNNEKPNCTHFQKIEWKDPNLDLYKNKSTSVKKSKHRHHHRKHRIHKPHDVSSGNSQAAPPQTKNLVRNKLVHKAGESRHKLPPTSSHTPPPPPFASSSSSSSSTASASVSATSLAATVSLAPSAFNIVAMLCRRKKKCDDAEDNSSASSDNQSPMDLQLVSQETSSGRVDFYDRADDKVKEVSRHQHSYHQKQASLHNQRRHQQQRKQQRPVTRSMPATPENIVQPQNHKYSNSTPKESGSVSSKNRKHSHRNRNRNTHSHSNSHSHNHSHSRSQQQQQQPQQHSYINLNEDEEDDLMKMQTNTNVNANYFNAIPALPKNFKLSLSDDSSYNNRRQQQQQPQQYSNLMTDFKLKHTLTPSPASQTHHRRHSKTAADMSLRRHKRDLSLMHSSTSQSHLRRRTKSLTAFLLPLKAVEETNDNEYKENVNDVLSVNATNNREKVSPISNDNDSDNDDIESGSRDVTRETMVDSGVGVHNSNRLLGNSNHVREDNNFQHQQHLLVNRLKLIYNNRISNDSSSNSKYNEVNILNNNNNKNSSSNNRRRQQQLQLQYNEGSLKTPSTEDEDDDEDEDKDEDEESSKNASTIKTSMFRYIKANLNAKTQSKPQPQPIRSNNSRRISNISHNRSKQNVNSYSDRTNVNISYNDIIISNDLNNDTTDVMLETNDDTDRVRSKPFASTAASAAAIASTAFHMRILFGQNMYRQLQLQEQLQVIDNKFNPNTNINNVHYTYDNHANNNNNNNVNVVVYTTTTTATTSTVTTTTTTDDRNDNGVKENDNDDVYGKFIQNENKYEKIIVQYRSVVDSLGRFGGAS